MNILVLHRFAKVYFLLQILISLKAVWAQREFGLEDFSEIRKSNTFVDKTLLIRKIFRQHPYLLITAPRHFGKSINFEMINLFLRNDQDQNQTDQLFEGTKLWADDKFISDHMYRYPVLFCNFDSGLEVLCEETLLSYYRQILYGIFIEHDYLKVSAALSEEQRKMFTSYIDENEDLETWKILTGLKFLTECLHLHHAKKVIVLIDEYDAIIVNELFREVNSSISSDAEYFNITREIVNFQSRLISTTLDNNNHVERALLTGTLALSIHQNGAKSASKIKHVGFTQNTEFIKFYGFTQKEVKGLSKRFNLTKDEESDVQKWYDGYANVKGKVRIVNPWALIKFLEDKLPYHYWVQLFPLTDILLPLMENTKVKETMVSLVQETGELSIQMKDTFSLKDLENLKKMIHKQWDDKTNLDIFYQFLLQVGYLTFDRPHKHVPKSSVLVKIPNLEIRQELSKMIKEYFSHMREDRK